MTPEDGRDTPFRLLTRLFLRRFLENDLVSPHADRRESLAVLLGIVVSISLFVAVLLSYGYLAAFILLPGVAALSALGDRFLFIAASVLICACGAVAVWDALALEVRDAAILGPLPIAVRTITFAKLASALAFGCALAIAWTVAPTVIYPLCLTANIRGVGGGAILQLAAAHATIVTIAGLSGFLAIVAVRGSLRALFGSRNFPRASLAAQSGLTVFLLTALLLTLRVQAVDVSGWLSQVPDAPVVVRPILWYVSLNEVAAGYRVAGAPIVGPPRIRSIAARVLQREYRAQETYRALAPSFASLAPRAWQSSLAALLLAVATFLWTNRRWPERLEAARGGSRVRAFGRALAERCTRADAEAQAGFFFSIHVMTRSVPHRAILAIAAAVGLTHACIALTRVTPIGVLATSTMAMLSLSAGFAYATRMPAEIQANWAIRTAWQGDERAYVRGVKRAGLLLAYAPVVILLPLYIARLGVATALVHALFSLILAVAAIDALFLADRKLAFACGYVPFRNPKFVWPAGIVGLMCVSYLFAIAESLVFRTAAHATALGLLLGAIAASLSAFDAVRRRERAAVDFEGRAEPLTQRLGLAVHTGQE